MKIRAVIADDEPRLAEYLREQLRLAWPDIDIIAVVHNGTEAIRIIANEKPELAFLDICMPGIDGVGVAWHAASTCKVVFVTAWKEYAVDAFAQGAVDYLLKPVTQKRLAVTLQRLKAHFSDAAPAYTRTGGTPSPFVTKASWLAMKVGSETRAIQHDDILYFEANGNYVHVFGNGISGTIRQTLHDVLAQAAPGKFTQIHRGIAVNSARIKSVRRIDDGAMLSLTGTDAELRVSRLYTTQFFGNSTR